MESTLSLADSATALASSRLASYPASLVGPR